MLTMLFAQDIQKPVPREGDLYKAVTVFGKTFEIRYGYYEDFERQYHEPMAIYPDFLKQPVYTDEGHPFVTAMQDICGHYAGAAGGEACCECSCFKKGADLLGLCTCLKNRKTLAGGK